MIEVSREHVPLVVVGYDFRVAGAQWRARLVHGPEEDDRLAEKLLAAGMARGLVVLGTCNRQEWLAASDNPPWCAEALRAYVMRRLREASGVKEVPEPYVYTSEAAVRHVLQTAAGLESFVLGERQIAGQLQCAFRVAQKRDHSDVILHGLAHAAGRVAKEAARAGLGSPDLRGVHDLALRHLMRDLPSEAACTLVVLGYGDIGKRVVDSARARTRWQVRIVNRTHRPGKEVLPLEALPALLAEADALIVATGAPTPVLTRERIPPRGERVLPIVDIGIPAQGEAELAERSDLRYLDLDGLQRAEGCVDQRQTEGEALRPLIEGQLAEYVRFCRERAVVPVLHTAQTQHERMIRERIPRLLEEELPDVPPEQRERLAFRLRGLVRDYTNAMIDAIHQQAERHD